MATTAGALIHAHSAERLQVEMYSSQESSYTKSHSYRNPITSSCPWHVMILIFRLRTNLLRDRCNTKLARKIPTSSFLHCCAAQTKSHSYRNPITSSCHMHKTRFIFELRSIFAPSRELVHWSRCAWEAHVHAATVTHASEKICTCSQCMPKDHVRKKTNSANDYMWFHMWHDAIDWQASAKQGLTHWHDLSLWGTRFSPVFHEWLTLMMMLCIAFTPTPVPPMVVSKGWMGSPPSPLWWSVGWGGIVFISAWVWCLWVWHCNPIQA